MEVARALRDERDYWFLQCAQRGGDVDSLSFSSVVGPEAGDSLNVSALEFVSGAAAHLAAVGGESDRNVLLLDELCRLTKSTLLT